MQKVHVAIKRQYYNETTPEVGTGEVKTEVQIKIKIQTQVSPLRNSLAPKRKLNFIFMFWVVLLRPKDVWHSN